MGLFPTTCRCSGQPAKEQSGNRIFVLISIVYTDPPTSLQCLFVLCDHKDANSHWIFGKNVTPRLGARDSCMHTCRYSGGSHDDDQGKGRRCKEMGQGRATSLRPSPKAAPTQTQKLQEDWYLICSPQSPPQSTKGQPPYGGTLWNGGVINVGGAGRHVQCKGRQATVKERQHVLQPPALAGIPRGQ